MQIVFETSDYPEALIKKGLLEQAGFLVHMDNAGVSSIMPHLGLALGNRLWVPDEDVGAAMRLISDKTLSQDLPEQGDAIDTCPNCGGWQVTRHRSMIWLPVFLIADLLMAPIGGRKRKCDTCGHAFDVNRPDITVPMKILFVLLAGFFLFQLGLAVF